MVKKWLLKILNVISIIFIALVILFAARVPIVMSIFWVWSRIGLTPFEVQDASKIYCFKLAEGTYDANYNPGLMRAQISGQLIGKAEIYVFPVADSARIYGHEEVKSAYSVQLNGQGDLSQFEEIDFYSGNHAFIVYIPEKGTHGELTIKAKL